MNTVAILPISNASGEKSYHAVSGNNNLYEAMKDICQWIIFSYNCILIYLRSNNESF
jgi:hypothetical protein